MTNSADPDLKKPTDWDLHCLQRQGISWFSKTRVKNPGKVSRFQMYIIFFLSYPENRIWHFMQTISCVDSLQEMPGCILGENKKIF